VLVAIAGRVPAATPCADEAEDRVVFGERRIGRGGGSTTRAIPRGIGRYESAASPPNARKFAPLNQTPDGRPRHTDRTTGLLDGDELLRHTERITDHLPHRSSPRLIVSVPCKPLEYPGLLPSRGDVVETDLTQQYKSVRVRYSQAKMVEAAGVEREIGVIDNSLMARDFWS